MRTLVLAAALAAPAAQAALAHDLYDGWERPDQPGVSCCGGADCFATELCTMPNGGEGVLIRGACLPIPYDAVMPFAAPDGGVHACLRASARGTTEPEPPVCVAMPWSS